MKKGNKIIVLFVMIILLSGCKSVSEPTSEINSDTTFSKVSVEDNYFDGDIISGINQTGYDVIDILYRNDKSENVLFSPISLTSALSMLENGASGITKTEIIEVLNLKTDENLNETYNKLISHFYQISDNADIEDRPMTTVNLANSFWFRNNNLIIKDSYIDTIKSYYDGDIYSVDFADDKTKDSMNQWIEDKTNGLLKNTIKSTNSDDIAYLINTLYFNGGWRDEFYEYNTDRKDFTLNTGEVVAVDMMSSKTMRSYYASEEIQVVALDYSDASMYVILPRGDIDSFIEKYNYNEINEMINRLDYKDVDLFFPKFKFSNNNDLVKILKELGMPSAFDFSTAEFDNMIESGNDVAVSKAFQNTTIEVDEEGTEAAAVTVISVNETCISEPKEAVIMNCNKPFMFIIRDNKSQCDLFIGIVQNPSEN